MAGPVQPPQPPYGPPPWPINQPPHPSGYPYPYPGAYPPPPNPRRVEYATAMLLWAVPAGVLPLFWFYSLFAMMGVDVCSDTSPLPVRLHLRRLRNGLGRRRRRSNRLVPGDSER